MKSLGLLVLNGLSWSNQTDTTCTIDASPSIFLHTLTPQADIRVLAGVAVRGFCVERRRRTLTSTRLQRQKRHVVPWPERIIGDLLECCRPGMCTRVLLVPYLLEAKLLHHPVFVRGDHHPCVPF